VANRGISYSGRAARWLFLRAPYGAVRHTAQGFVDTATDAGRRWVAWGMLGAWLWAFRWGAEHVIRTKQTLAVTALLLLLWIIRGLSLLRWTWHLRVERSRARAIQRREFELLEQIGTKVNEWGQRVPEGVAVLRSVRDDEGYRDVKANGREQAEQVRQWNADNPTFADMPMGDQFEPVFRLPKRFRRKPRKGDDAE
jgi:hypothetical protein